MSNADLGSLDFTLHINDKEFNESVQKNIQRAQNLNTSISTLLDLRKKYNSVSKEEVANARNSNRILREENKTREMNRREIIKTRKELVKLNAEKARANGVGGGGNLAAQQSMLSNITNLAMKYVSIWGAASLIKNIASVTAEFELQRIALQAMIADTAKANQVYNQIWDLALKSPFNAKELVTYAKQLVAYSIPVNELFETTKMLADVSAGLGVGMDRLVLAYGQIRSASFLRGQEVRQLTEAGIPILEELRKQFVELGEETITVGDVFDKISKRLVPFEMVEKVFKNMTSEGGKFYQMQEVQAETLKGKLMILRDAYDKMFAAIGEKNKSTLKSAVEWATNLARNYDKTMGTLKALVAAYGAYKVALELAILGEKGFLVASTIKKITETASRMRRLTGEAQTFAIVMRNLGEANVKKAFATLAGAIALVATALIVAARNAGALNRELAELSGTKYNEAANLASDFQKLAQRIRETNEGSQARRDAISELNRKYGEYLPNLLNEVNALKELDKYEREVTNAIYARQQAYAQEEGMRKIEEKYGKKMTNYTDALIKQLRGAGVSQDAANEFVQNFRSSLEQAFADGKMDSASKMFTNKIDDYFGSGSRISNLIKTSYPQFASSVADFVNGFKDMSQASEDFTNALEARFGIYAYSTEQERKAIQDIVEEYARLETQIREAENQSAEDTEAKLLDNRKKKLDAMIAAYQKLNQEAEAIGKGGIWNTQLEKLIAERASLDEKDLSWLQKIVNPLVDDKNRDLKPQDTDQYEEYIDNLRNIYKKQVSAVDDLANTYNKFVEDRKKGLKVDEDAYQKSKQLYEIEKHRKEVIEAIGKALGISVDDKITGNSGKTDEQIRLEMQISTLKDMEKWYDKLKEIGMSGDNIRDILKEFYPDQDILNTSRSFRDELLKMADALEKFDKKAAQALRDDISGYGLDDLFDNLKKSLDASKKLDSALAKLKEETRLEGTGVTFDVSKIIHDYSKAMRDINAKAQETWDEAYKSFDSGNFVDVEQMLKTVGDYVATQTNNAMAKAIDAVDATADNWVKEWAKIKGIDLEHWSDMTIGQLNAVRDALRGLFDESGNLVEGDDFLDAIKAQFFDENGVERITGAWEAFEIALRRVVGVNAEGNDGDGGLLGKVDEIATKEKIKLLKYVVDTINDLAESIDNLADASGNDELKSFSKDLSSITEIAKGAGEGAAAGGWIGAIVGGLAAIGKQMIEDAAHAEMLAQKIRLAQTEAQVYQWNKAHEDVTTIFGEDELSQMRIASKNMAEIDKAYKALIDDVMDLGNQWRRSSSYQEGKNWKEAYKLEDYMVRTLDRWWGAQYTGGYDRWESLGDLALNLGYQLFDEYGHLSSVALQAILDNYEDLHEYDKKWMQSAIEYAKAYEKELDDVKDVMEKVIGSVVDDFATDIVDQWVAAGDAAADYANILDEVARSYAKIVVKNVLMDSVFRDFDTKKMADLVLNGESDKAMQMLEDALQKAQDLAPVLTPILEKFDKYFQSADSTALGEGIKGVTEDTANLLASYLNGMRGDLAKQREAVEAIKTDFETFWKATYHPTLDEYLHNIEANTHDTAQNTSDILNELRSVITTASGASAIRVEQ